MARAFSKTKVILVIEDHLQLAEAIKIKLEKSGFSVIIATTVDQAWKILEERRQVDAIWLDHYLTGKDDGLDFVTKLKSRTDDLKDLPIFLISNTASLDKVSLYLRLGINKYYIKAESRLATIISEIQSFLKIPTR